jgi:FkbM family methyltransferase
MMHWRARLKRWRYGTWGRAGAQFPYWGVPVHYPRGSLMFDLVCTQGIFEHGNLRVLSRLVRPDSWLFDVGCNIGLMSVPLLREHGGLRVAAFEPVPWVADCLARTAAHPSLGGRLQVHRVALSDAPGQAQFAMGAAGDDAYSGLRDTGRGWSDKRRIEVTVRTLDAVWQELGEPPVSAIKLDVEGADSLVLAGARACLARCRPAVLLEWNETNLRAYGIVPTSLIALATSLNYACYTAPELVPVRDAAHLQACMAHTESFLMLPLVSSSQGS